MNKSRAKKKRNAAARTTDPQTEPNAEDVPLGHIDGRGKDKESLELERVRHILLQEPELAEVAMGLTTRSLLRKLINRMASEGVHRDLLEARSREIRRDLGFEKASISERLLIEQVILSYFRLVQAEGSLTHATEGPHDTQHALYWEKRVSAAQRRHVRAIESLTRVRKLLGRPEIQINVAMNGGQQVVSNGEK